MTQASRHIRRGLSTLKFPIPSAPLKKARTITTSVTIQTLPTTPSFVTITDRVIMYCTLSEWSKFHWGSISKGVPRTYYFCRGTFISPSAPSPSAPSSETAPTPASKPAPSASAASSKATSASRRSHCSTLLRRFLARFDHRSKSWPNYLRT